MQTISIVLIRNIADVQTTRSRSFLLENPVSDLGNPDCLASYVSWNKNPIKD